LATRCTSSMPRPRKRSTAFMMTFGFDEILTSAMARTRSGMPTRVYAPCTCTSMGMLRMSMVSTVSMMGTRMAQPPLTTR